MAVLVVGNAVLFSRYTVTVDKLNSATVQATESNDARQKASKDLQEVLKQKMDIDSSLKEEQLKSKKLQEENDGLKAKLQAKNERKKNQEANLYAWGNCTWYVKEKVPYIGGTWGNANQWLASAQGYGYDVGDTPKPGAIGVSFEGYYGHVAYVESVNDNGTITISEMNAPVLAAVSTRVVPKQMFHYIYT